MFFNIALIVLNDGTPGKKSEHNKPVSAFLELSLTRLLSSHEAFVLTTRCFGGSALRFLSVTSRSGLPIDSDNIDGVCKEHAGSLESPRLKTYTYREI